MGEVMALKIWMLGAVVIGVCLPEVAGAAILDGGVSFDAVSGLYTYSYVIDNRSGPADITDLSVLINTESANFTLFPDAHTEPDGSNFHVAVSGGSANPPLNEFGTFWEWECYAPVGSETAGFSFTTAVPPAQTSENNYFIFASRYYGGVNGDGIVEYGHVVGPMNVPEPGTWGVAAGGLVVLGRMRLRRHRERAVSR
jgi:hypothetical protein